MLDLIALFLVFIGLERLMGSDWAVGLLFIMIAVIIEVIERKIIK